MKRYPTRQAYGEVMLEIAKENKDLHIIDSDISKSMHTFAFSQKYPDQHTNVGIAEQNAASFAAGLATTGKTPVISTYAVFGSMRMLEQVRTSICYPNLHVIVACSHGGLTPANDGVTHQAIEDMGIYRTIPNMSVIMPADYHSTKALIRKAVNDATGPLYIRFTRDAVLSYYDENETFEIGKGKLLQEGDDVSLICTGDLLEETLKAAQSLKKEGIYADVIDMHTIKPLDIELVKQTLSKTKYVVTIEDHSIYNGLGSAVAEVIAEIGFGRQVRIGLKDTFAESGKYNELIEKYEMDANAICAAVFKLVKK